MVDWQLFARYVVAGIVNTIIGYLIFFLLVYFGSGYYLSFSITHILGIVINFRTYSVVFKSKDSSKIYAFIVVYFILFISGNSFIYIIGIFKLSTYSWLLVVLVMNSILGYVLQKKYVFSMNNLYIKEKGQ